MPYIELKEGEVTGLTGKPAVEAFKNSKVPYVLKYKANKDQIKDFFTNEGEYCGIGWYKTKAREKFGKFTKAIYVDNARVAVLSISNGITNGISLAGLFANKNLKLLTKRYYSYGWILDTAIAEGKPSIVQSDLEEFQMLLEVSTTKGSYMLLAPEELEGLLKVAGVPREALSILTFSDYPKGESRHIWCSNSVSDDTISKLNAVIR